MIKKTATKVNKLQTERVRLEQRNIYGCLVQRTTRGTFSRPKSQLYNTATGTGEARWA
jgi:hypothetical protein